MADWLDKLRKECEGAILEEEQFRGERTLFIRKEALLDVCSALRCMGFDFLVDLCGVDTGPNSEPRFYVVYHLRNMVTKDQVRLKVGTADGEKVDSVTGIWPGADWLEREVYDMFGIEFVGHPHLTRLYLPEDFPGHPLRKDYPTEGYDFEE